MLRIPFLIVLLCAIPGSTPMHCGMMDCEIEMATKYGNSTTLTVFEDMIMPNHYPINFERQMKIVKELPYIGGDILMCSYPKCGLNWMNALIRGLLKTSRDENERPSLPLLEYITAETIDGLDAPRFFTTHLKPKRLPKALVENKCKIVLVLRNPKDVAVSYYYHLKNSEMSNNPQSWHEYLESFMSGVIPWGNYFEYLKDWKEVVAQSKAGGNNISVECFFFEDMKDNLLETLRRLNKYLECNKNSEELLKIGACNSFKILKEATNADMEKIPKWLRKKDGSSVIFRKGEIGDWKNHFTVGQNEVFDKEINSRLNGSIFKFRYE